VIFRVIRGEHPHRPTPGDCGEIPLSDKLWAIIEKCWSNIPAERPDIATVLPDLQRQLFENINQAMHLATLKGDLTLMQTFIHWGASVDTPGIYPYFHLAIIPGLKKHVQMLGSDHP
jgi:hypothetical protein